MLEMCLIKDIMKDVNNFQQIGRCWRRNFNEQEESIRDRRLRNAIGDILNKHIDFKFSSTIILSDSELQDLQKIPNIETVYEQEMSFRNYKIKQIPLIDIHFKDGGQLYSEGKFDQFFLTCHPSVAGKVLKLFKQKGCTVELRQRNDVNSRLIYLCTIPEIQQKDLPNNPAENLSKFILQFGLFKLSYKESMGYEEFESVQNPQLDFNFVERFANSKGA